MINSDKILIPQIDLASMTCIDVDFHSPWSLYLVLFCLFQDFPSPLQSPPDYMPPPPVTITAATPDSEVPPTPIAPVANGSGEILYACSICMVIIPAWFFDWISYDSVYEQQRKFWQIINAAKCVSEFLFIFKYKKNHKLQWFYRKFQFRILSKNLCSIKHCLRLYTYVTKQIIVKLRLNSSK